MTPTSDEWTDHFSSLYSGNNSLNTSSNQRIANTIKSLSQKLDPCGDATPAADHGGSDALMASFGVETVLKGIQRLKSGKAVASDLISNDMIKASGDIIAPVLTSLFNRILKNEYPPDVWGLGIIVPLLKAGDTTDVNNYRGITINSCLSKLFMLLLNDRLQEFCDNRNIILYNQIGFRKLFRPADHVFTLKTLIDKAFSEKKQLYTCFVDFKKAYDTVWRDGLFYKLLENGISRSFVRLLRNIYSASSLCVKVPGGRSIDFPSAVGLKQGCNLSPLLFNIFINDFLVEIDGHQIGSPYLGDIPVNGLFYADDLVLVSETKEGLQILLDKLYDYTSSWCLQVNKSKTKCVVFSKQNKRPINVVSFGGAPLVTAETYCYLGTIFSRNGSLNDAGHMLHKKAIKALHGLIEKVHKYKSCDPKIMLDLFDKMILPISMYNSEIWGTMCFPVNENNSDFLGVSPQKNPVEDVQIKLCKRLLQVRDTSSNWGAISELGRHPTIILIMEKIIKFWDHVTQTKSPILRAALQTNVNLDASGKRVWFSFLRRCLKQCELDHILYTSDPQEISHGMRKVKSLLRSKAISYWNERLHKTSEDVGSKLNFYSRAKKVSGYAEYLSACSNPTAKSAISKFRISAHNLPIEVRRYVNIQREDRLCPFCNSCIGDEKHYLIECMNPLFVKIRKPVFSYIVKKFPNFSLLDPIDKASFLLKCEDPPSITKVGKFCHEVLEIFKEFNTIV